MFGELVMSKSWYYVENGERKGPVDELTLIDSIKDRSIRATDYVWSKGFENWEKVEEVAELAQYLNSETSSAPPQESSMQTGSVSQQQEVSSQAKQNPQSQQTTVSQQQFNQHIDFRDFGEHDRSFTIKIGVDRGAKPVVYGPYSLEILKKLFDENRINGKTLVYCKGMQDWSFMAEVSGFEQVFNTVPPVIEEQERRLSQRRPFVARMLFHDNSEVYEGTCRDISVGGMQVLVSNFPGVVGESISMNVHPDNSDFSFVASGKIVRRLDGDQGFSFRFTGLSEDARNTIENYVGQSD
jgi:hypothetical protein